MYTDDTDVLTHLRNAEATASEAAACEQHWLLVVGLHEGRRPNFGEVQSVPHEFQGPAQDVVGLRVPAPPVQQPHRALAHRLLWLLCLLLLVRRRVFS